MNEEQYFLPIFKCDIYLADNFFRDNITKKRAILFLNNIYECFDWLTEKLIDRKRIFNRLGWWSLF